MLIFPKNFKIFAFCAKFSLGFECIQSITGRNFSPCSSLNLPLAAGTARAKTESRIDLTHHLSRMCHDSDRQDLLLARTKKTALSQ